ncbi:hypothetical protein GWI33_005183 [Rhynchophorus ferrugineus]|uniref:Uncharacterized protein n=1 Tax=Rhynchophorus ferrugineus TaxID=354439 RepID=A0A834IH64_RHYFE|nr:hypothetical protein GWI33_005183 [Rhynchophorus ferrugineus]
MLKVFAERRFPPSVRCTAIRLILRESVFLRWSWSDPEPVDAGERLRPRTPDREGRRRESGNDAEQGNRRPVGVASQTARRRVVTQIASDRDPRSRRPKAKPTPRSSDAVRD